MPSTAVYTSKHSTPVAGRSTNATPIGTPQVSPTKRVNNAAVASNVVEQRPPKVQEVDKSLGPGLESSIGKNATEDRNDVGDSMSIISDTITKDLRTTSETKKTIPLTGETYTGTDSSDQSASYEQNVNDN